MVQSYLLKAQSLREIEDKILDLSHDFDIKIFTQLFKEFYEGVRELKNEMLEIASISFDPVQKIHERELVEYLQGILMESDFKELHMKMLLVVVYNLQQSIPDFDITLLFSNPDYISESINKLQGEIRSEVMELMSTDAEFEDYETDDKLTMDVLYNVFNPYIYISDLRKAGVLIITSDAEPENFSRVTSTIKECYAFQQYLAVAVLCRTAIEIALKDLYNKLGFTTKKSPENSIAKQYFNELRKKSRKTYPNEFDPSPRDLRNLICKLPEYEKFEENLDNMYGNLSRIVHGSMVINKEKSEYYMKETFWLIHEMYLELKLDVDRF